MSSYNEVVLDGEMSLDIHMDGELEVVVKVTEHDLPIYTGNTEIIPSDETQILQTESTTVLQNIIINAIPSNYGKITWNGATLTVS